MEKELNEMPKWYTWDYFDKYQQIYLAKGDEYSRELPRKISASGYMTPEQYNYIFYLVFGKIQQIEPIRKN